MPGGVRWRGRGRAEKNLWASSRGQAPQTSNDAKIRYGASILVRKFDMVRPYGCTKMRYGASVPITVKHTFLDMVCPYRCGAPVPIHFCIVTRLRRHRKRVTMLVPLYVWCVRTDPALYVWCVRTDPYRSGTAPNLQLSPMVTKTTPKATQGTPNHTPRAPTRRPLIDVEWIFAEGPV